MILKTPNYILSLIIFAQFCGTSLWFSGNAIINDLIIDFNIENDIIGEITIAVQLGFVIGTLTFALLSIVDTYSPSKVFFLSALLASVCNIGLIIPESTISTILLCRFCTGFFLAGIYPVGMKIAADYYEKGLGLSLGYLVGALVLGTAFPHFIRNFIHELPWKLVLIYTSILASFGGLILYTMVPDGINRKKGALLNISQTLSILKNYKLRQSAIGYFGHMWELYAFWALVPVMLSTYNFTHLDEVINVPLNSFYIIGLGAVACIMGGYLSEKIGTKKVALYSLFLSMLCCLASPFVITYASSTVLVIFLLFWGMVVVADSPLFSTLVAQSIEPEKKGTAITIVTSLGFTVTIVSLQFMSMLVDLTNLKMVLPFLALGPVISLMLLSRRRKT
ncbi:MFS transporter [Dokdonia sp. Hel_I_53]|uniref:MFS transporter n=1 Tax=Dokdonia sp. Hel_I_53 TaxID=1566287 RepID=UPI00119C8A88|nr:MFS transporter [Dokdonia sp. Hel_I_53]TVZ52709.1 putative MFS family arabinose efflux permease [Dokdonia sp. Hel_I_53]